MAGTIVASTLSDGTNSTSTTNCITGSAKAWVNFQGGNGTSAGTINNSFNVSSITVNGTGDYTINFTTAMSNINYVPAGMTQYSSGSGAGATYLEISRTASSITTTYLRVICSSGASLLNVGIATVVIFGS